MKAMKLRPFIPSGTDYPRAVQFYIDLGFEKVYYSDELTIFKFDDIEFHLQNYQNTELQHNYMVELCVQDLDAWWQHIQDSELVNKYDIRVKPPQIQPYGKRAIHLIDTAGVLWHMTE
ncbi:hypothetical protein [Paenibacillus sp. FSL W7-1287]|uniref:hypothetical protein n=1 Tax=Paenibacillus sp. FSL W7-1287 TaxID=2954538 RepID=UPI0030F57464